MSLRFDMEAGGQLIATYQGFRVSHWLFWLSMPSSKLHGLALSIFTGARHKATTNPTISKSVRGILAQEPCLSSVSFQFYQLSPKDNPHCVPKRTTPANSQTVQGACTRAMLILSVSFQFYHMTTLFSDDHPGVNSLDHSNFIRCLKWLIICKKLSSWMLWPGRNEQTLQPWVRGKSILLRVD